MRNASRLCRGLSEAAQSIERPYIPRHVPLPSSSYSAAAATAARTSPPAHALDKRHLQDAELQRESNSTRLPRKAESFRASLARHGVTTPSASQHNNQSQSPSDVRSPKGAREDRQVLLAPSTDSRDFPPLPSSVTDAEQGAVPRQSHRTHPCVRPPTHHSPELTPKAKRPGLSTKRLSSKGIHQHSPASKASTSLSLSDHVKVAYPALSDPQASLLVETFHRIQSLRLQAPSAVASWYEDHVWTVERQSGGKERIGSSQSISMLLRYAYLRNDLRSLLRIESRAARFRPSVTRSPADTLASASTPELPEMAHIDEVPIWPECNENPRALAYNLKVAFAARQGDWVKVEELLDNADLLSSASDKLDREHRGTSRPRSDITLDAIGWGSLLRHGLGNVRRLDHTEPSTAAGADAFSAQPRPRSDDLSASTQSIDLPPEDADDRTRKAEEDAQQMQAKLSVTKHLLPNLLSFMPRPASQARSAKTAGDASKASAEVAESSTPSWLLQSVLAQLAERGETASTIRIVQLALSEASPALTKNAAGRRTATHVLNLALQACERNGSIQVTETLRVFNSLTSSQLGHDICGTPVLKPPTLLSGSNRPTKDANVEWRSAIVPNEESLVLLLKKVRHPLFRASWTRKLVHDFERLFPEVKVSGRTFRMALAKCLAPAPAPDPASAGPAVEPMPVSVPAVGKRVVASGRRGRRMRQAAAAHSLSSAPSDVTKAAARGPRLKISILTQTLDVILARFAAPYDPSRRLHLSTINRRRFEHTLLRAKRVLLLKRSAHSDKLRSTAAATGTDKKKKRITTHHTQAITQIDIALDRIAAVQRLGRCEEAHWKRHARTSTAHRRR